MIFLKKYINIGGTWHFDDPLERREPILEPLYGGQTVPKDQFD